MALSSPDIDFLRGLVSNQSGNVVADRQTYLLEQRLTPIANRVGLDDVSALVGYMRKQKSTKLETEVAEAFTVNETSFFRDVHPFEALRKTILPELISKRKATKRLNVWCGACSSGQEPYSLAMTIREMGGLLDGWKINILATDISEKMIAKSSSGEFSQLEANRGLPARKLVRFFERRGSMWCAKDELRSMIEHKRLNLTKPWPHLGEFDLVFMRNVLIYFDRPTKQEILCKANRVVRDDGYFFLGSSETTIGLNVPFVREQINDTVCYRSGK